MSRFFKLFAIIILVSSVTAIFGQTKVMKQGSYSNIETSYVFVARDATTYAQLQTLVEDLPNVATVDFTKNAVVAAFAGEKSKGGWAVEIKQSTTGIGISFQAPGKDMMSASVITYPFNVSLVPIAENKNLSLNLPTDISAKMQNFKVSKADFQFSGGIVGRTKKFKADGTLKLLTFGNYATVLFDLKGISADQTRRLSEIASGTLKDGNLELARLDAGNFADAPRPPFSVKGMLKGNNLSLNFAPLPLLNFDDGFAGKGSLVAVNN